MSFQGKMTGGQAGKAFKEFNELAEAEVVLMTRNYNTGDFYHNRVGDGNQIDLAFGEINAYVGFDLFNRAHLDWGTNPYLKLAFLKLKLLGDVLTTAPIWHDLPLSVSLSVGDSWPWAASDYIISGSAVTYTADVLPAGITLNTDGTFSGTATTGETVNTIFTATNDIGATPSDVVVSTVAAVLAPPVWSALPADVAIIVGGAWPWPLDTYVTSALPVTFENALTLPAGITLNADGTFTGTATTVLTGTVTFDATNSDGSVTSSSVAWAVTATSVARTTGTIDEHENSNNAENCK